MRRGVVVLDALEEAAVVVLHEAPVHHDLHLARGQRRAAQGLTGYQRHAAGEIVIRGTVYGLLITVTW